MDINNHIFSDSTKNNIEIDKSFNKINNNLNIVSLVVQNLSLSELKKMAFLNTGNDKASSLVISARNTYLIETEKLGYPISDDEENTLSSEIKPEPSYLMATMKNRRKYFEDAIESEKNTLSIAIKYTDAEKKVIDVECSIENILKIAQVFKCKKKDIKGIITEIKDLRTEDVTRSEIFDEIFETILSKKSFNYQANESDPPLLAKLVDHQYRDLIPILLENGADSNCRWGDNNLQITPFDKSMSSDYEPDYAIAELFLKHGVDESIKHKHLYQALIMGNQNKLEMLAKYVKNIDIKNQAGDTALITAIDIGNLDSIRILLNNKANRFIQDESGNTIFHNFLKRRPQEVTRLLLQDAVDLNITNKKGKTALHELITNNLEEAKIFLWSGADPNIIDKEGEAPLHIALSDHYTPGGAELLLKHRANPNIINNKGEAPLHILVSDSSYSKDRLELLLKYEANPNIKDKEGNSPLHLTILSDLDDGEDKLELLLKYEANPNIKDKEGKTPLHLAASSHSDYAKGIVKLLLKYGANPNIKDKEGKTAFDVADDDIKKILSSKKRIQLSSISTLISRKVNSKYKSLLHFLDKPFTSVSNFMRLSNKKTKPISIHKR